MDRLKYKLFEILAAAGVFTIGALGYGAIEILWRGHTHPSMLLAGGIAFFVIFALNLRHDAASILLKSIACALTIITVELLFGLIFNMLLGMNVWDYSGKKFNFYGQICFEYALYWLVLSTVICAIFTFVLRKVRNRTDRTDS